MNSAPHANVPDTIDPGSGLSDLKSRAGEMSQEPGAMNPDTVARERLEAGPSTSTKPTAGGTPPAAAPSSY